MGYDALKNAARMQALQQLGARSSARFGTVSSYNPAKHLVKVLLQPENVESAWMPYMEAFAGNGWGLMCGPTVGNMALVLFLGDSPDNPVALGMFFNNQDQPPKVPSGELWAVHKTGAFLKLTTAGQVLAQDSAGSTVTLNGDGTITAGCSGGMTLNAGSLTVNAPTTINGTLHASGTISGGADIDAAGNVQDSHGTMQAIRTTYDGHTHPNGSPNTGTPNQTM